MTARRVLVIDDDFYFRQLVRSVVEARGHTLLEAVTGEDAKRLMRSPGADLVIVDGLLPDGDGVIWITWMRSVGFKTPAVFVSAQGRDSDRFRRLVEELQVGLVLRKPVMLPVLGEQIEQLLSGSTPEEDEDPLAAELEKSLAGLRAEYARSLPGRVGELGRALARLRLEESEHGLVRQLAHRLRGTAGTYGFNGVSDASGRIEDAVVELEGGRPLAELWPGLQEAMDACARLAGIAESGPHHEMVSRPAFSSARPLRSSNAGETLLVVDDDPQILEFIQALGKRHLLQIVPARTADDALRLAALTFPDAMLLDVNLGADGQSFRLPFQLRSLPGLAGLPVGFMSTDRERPNRAAAAYAGAALFLAKPIDPAAFGTGVRQLLAVGRGVQPNVVVASENAALLDDVSRLLSQLGAHGIRVQSSLDVERVVSERSPDLLLLDTAMTGLSSYDACRALRMDPLTHDLPIVLLSSARGGRGTAFRAGADDVLNHPLAEDEALARIRMLIERHRLQKEVAITDALTGLRTRTSFLMEVARQLESMQRAGKPFTLALLDIDGFTALNETEGVEAGDHLLASLGLMVRNSMMSDVIRGRWSGDEIALALPGEDADSAAAICQWLVAQFNDHRKLEGLSRVSFSIGQASSPDDGVSSDDLRRAAERRLRKAKANPGSLMAGDPQVAHGTGGTS